MWLTKVVQYTVVKWLQSFGEKECAWAQVAGAPVNS